MHRQSLAPNRGMLFPYDPPQVASFWMKNTLIPLDIVFIGKDLTIAGTIANAKPLDLSSRGVGKPSLYVLEVNGGWMAAHGVADGSKVTFENVEAAAH